MKPLFQKQKLKWNLPMYTEDIPGMYALAPKDIKNVNKLRQLFLKEHWLYIPPNVMQKMQFPRFYIAFKSLSDKDKQQVKAILLPLVQGNKTVVQRIEEYL